MATVATNAGWKPSNLLQIRDDAVRQTLLDLQKFLASPSFKNVSLVATAPVYNATTKMTDAAQARVVDGTNYNVPDPLSITTTMIADDSISTPKLKANSVTANELAAINIAVGKYIRSTSYVAGTSGWSIDAAGSAEFNNVTVRGTLYLTGTGGRKINVVPVGTYDGNAEIQMYTGDVQESQPGTILVEALQTGTPTAYRLSTFIQSPFIGTKHCALELNVHYNSGAPYSQAQLNAYNAFVTGDNFCEVALSPPSGAAPALYLNTTGFNLVGDIANTATAPTIKSVASSGDITIDSGSGVLTLAGRSLSLDLFAGWTAYTANVDQGITTNITKTVAYSAYMQYGKTVIFAFAYNITGAGTANADIRITNLPVTPKTGGQFYGGTGIVFDASVPNRFPVGTLLTSIIRFIDHTAPNNLLYIGQTGTAMAAALANGDAVSGQVIYEAN